MGLFLVLVKLIRDLEDHPRLALLCFIVDGLGTFSDLRKTLVYFCFIPFLLHHALEYFPLRCVSKPYIRYWRCRHTGLAVSKELHDITKQLQNSPEELKGSLLQILVSHFPVHIDVSTCTLHDDGDLGQGFEYGFFDFAILTSGLHFVVSELLVVLSPLKSGGREENLTSILTPIANLNTPQILSHILVTKTSVADALLRYHECDSYLDP